MRLPRPNWFHPILILQILALMLSAARTELLPSGFEQRYHELRQTMASDDEKAEALLVEIKADIEARGLSQLRPVFLIEKARLAYYRDEYTAGLGHLDEAEAGVVGDFRDLTSDIWLLRSHIYVYMKNFESAKGAAQKAIDGFSNLADPEGSGEANFAMANAYIRSQEFGKAIPYYNRSIDILQATDTSRVLAKAFLNRGIANRHVFGP